MSDFFIMYLRRFSTCALRFNAAHEYSGTVALPTSKFTSRSEPDTVAKVKTQTTDELYRWNVDRPLKDNDIKNLFILHDGPPYANGNLHVGHALNKILKDIIVRSELLRGKKVHYKPGWDCHGLPIEIKALEKLGKQRKAQIKALKKQLKTAEGPEKARVQEKIDKLHHERLSPLDIIKLSREHALATQKTQSQSFQEMGIMGDFEHPYLTLHRSFVINQLRAFKKMFDRGLVHRQEKPVYWGCENATALAEGELEYNNHVSKTAYIKFPISNTPPELQRFDKLCALIWTSTPWTLASNLAICINKKFNYTILESDQEQVIVSSDLVDAVKALKPELNDTDVEMAGSDLLSLKYINPLDDSEHPFIHGSHVTNTTGTGLVHTAPGHGQDDYLVCKQYNIKPYSPVDNHGRYTSDLPATLSDFVGLKVLGEGNEKMLEKLAQLDMTFARDDHYVHSYPYDWRSKKPIIIRATPQWFIDVSQIKEPTVDALVNRVQFHPEKGSHRLISFIRTRNEWCISRQRSWGVPIPVLYKKDTGEPLLTDKVIQKITEVIEKEDIDSWFKDDDMAKWLPDDFEGDPNDYVKGRDTMDVWFDSGSSWNVIKDHLEAEGLLEQANKRGYLADMYLEGSDQHRGWFQSSVLIKVGSSPGKLVLPYQQIVTHGFTLDEKGEKMSKSLGNTILPDDILNGNKNLHIPALGIDGLRLWVAQSDYSSDVSIGPTILKRVGDNLKKIRFTFKFLLGNLSDFDYKPVPYNQLDGLDKFVLSKAYELERTCKESYKTYNYSKITKDVSYMVSSVLSSIYFDIRKDILYTDKRDSLARRATQTTMVEILKVLVSVLSPILPLVTQEVWNYSPKEITGGVDSPFKAGWYTADSAWHRPDIEEDFEKLFSLRDNVRVLIDTAVRKDKTVRNTLETAVYVKADGETYDLLKKYESQLVNYLLVSQFYLNEPIPESEFNYESIEDGVQINVVKSDKLKCPRCWKFTRDEGKDLCDRCDDVVKSLQNV